MILQTIAAAFTRKPLPEPAPAAEPSPLEAGQALSSLTQRSITAREHEKRKAEMTHSSAQRSRRAHQQIDFRLGRCPRPKRPKTRAFRSRSIICRNMTTLQPNRTTPTL